LESLVGTLQHATKVIHPGRSFMWKAINMLKWARRPNHYIWLNQQFNADLQWWRAFAESWNGWPISLPQHPSTRSLLPMPQALGMWGMVSGRVVAV